MIPRISLLIVSAFTVLSSIASPAIAEDGFVPMFNGRDLSGWVNVNCAPETWAIKDGIVTCTGVPTGALRTEKQYENFIMELEWRHMRSGGNAGVFIWASPIAAPGVPFLRAIEVQVLDHGYGNTENYTTHGDVFPIHGSTMKPFGEHRGMRSFPSERRSKPSPEWNHYRIECNAGTLRLSVNGKEVSGGEDCIYRKGYIGLESEGAPTEWRNIQIKELPASGATPEQSAPLAEGHVALYNGLDLRGWTTGKESAWKASDWKLVAGKIGSPETIWSTATFANPEFVVDAKGNGVAPAIAVQRGSGPLVRIPLNDASSKWSRAVISVGGNAVSVKGGEAESKYDLGGDSQDRVKIGLDAGEAGAEYANIYAREK